MVYYDGQLDMPDADQLGRTAASRAPLVNYCRVEGLPEFFDFVDGCSPPMWSPGGNTKSGPGWS